MLSLIDNGRRIADGQVREMRLADHNRREQWRVRGRNDDLLWRLLEASPGEWAMFVLALLALIAVCWAIIRVTTWFRDGAGPAESEQVLLTHFRELHRQGDLSDEEYRSIKGRLVARFDDSQAPSESSE